MNIIFYKNNGIVAEKGGISRITVNLCHLFREKGYGVWFIGSNNVFDKEGYDNNQFFLPDEVNVRSDENVHYLCDFIKRHSIDVIINQHVTIPDHLNFLSCCSKITGVKLIFCFHNSILTPIYRYAYSRQYLLYKKGYSWVFRLLDSLICRRLMVAFFRFKNRSYYRGIISSNHAVVLLSEGQVHELELASGKREISNAHVIYNSMPVQGIIPQKHSKIVLWVGSFDYSVKRPDNMLRIWSKVEQSYPEWTLYMLGDGVSLNDCMEMASKLGLHNVYFMGRVAPDDYYKEAEILCMTSVHECFPMVLLEGMNNGLALVAFDSFTSAKLLVEEEDNGKLVSPFDIDEYVKTLGELLNNTQERHRLQTNSLRAAKRFSEDIIFNMWDGLFKTILK